jgi:hypothetical protein
MRPLCQLLEGGFVGGRVRAEDVAVLQNWGVVEGGLVAPDGPEAARVRITPRLRPMRSAGELLASRGAGNPKRAWTFTLEGHYASLAATSTAWTGVVLGPDFVYAVEGEATPAYARRIGRVVCALVSFAELDLGDERPRAVLHRGPAGWSGDLDEPGRTTWRSPEGALITVWPATPRRRETPALRMQRWLTGDPLALLRAPARIQRKTPIKTELGLTGLHLQSDEEDAAILEDPRFRYFATLRGDGRRAFASLLETMTPIPRPVVATARESYVDHWVA